MEIDNFNTWFKKNWFTLLGIFIICMVTLWYYGKVETRLIDCQNQCNEHWIQQVRAACPAVLEIGYTPEYNLSNMLNTGWEDK